jgi:uncharacterized protein YbjT (DUF2867 family)
LLRRLKEEGHWVRALVRRPEQAAALGEADEVFVGEVTDPSTLGDVAAGVELVCSTIGITRQRDGVGYEQVDFAGNLALLREAERAGAGRFLYVSVLHGPELRRTVALAAAKERFVDALRASSLPSTVVRPTGYFSDMESFFDMARRGVAFVFGDGRQRMNPISGTDLARACVTAADGVEELEVGGPDVLTQKEIVELAFSALDKKPRVWHLPTPLITGSIGLMRHVTPQRINGPAEFLAAVMTRDMVAPPTGNEHLADHFATLAARN